MKINHAGFAVEDLEKAIELYAQLGFTVKNRFEKPEPHAFVATVVDENGAGLELWQFDGEHPLQSYIGRHVAFVCDDVRHDAGVMVQNGYKEVIPYTEGVKMNYIFVEDSFGAVFELAQKR